jgi:hypothetical protein
VQRRGGALQHETRGLWQVANKPPTLEHSAAPAPPINMLPNDFLFLARPNVGEHHA